MSLVGSTLGNIRIEAPLGSGGMGEVYLGFHLKLERRVAVKTIRRERRLSAAAKARLLREARVLSQLGHPGICQVYDLVETPEADFLVLELIDGKTLAEVAELAPPYEEKLRLAEEIAAILGVAHRQQIVHRDVKPENVMVTRAGAVKVLDFGLARPLGRAAGPDTRPADLDRGKLAGDGDASDLDPFGTLAGGGPPLADVPSSDDVRLTEVGSVVGTVAYMSPEQARGEEATTASDVYALGVLLQELFTRRPVYEPGSPGVVLGRVARGETVPVEGVDPDLSRLLERMKRLPPLERPTAEQVAARLRWIRDRPRRQRRQRLQLLAAGAAVALMAVGLAVVSYLAVSARRARDEAEQRRRQAEGLVGFMLDDLRPKLEGAGRLDLLDAVGERALAYFATVPEELLTDDELDRRAQAVRHLAEVRVDQGNLDGAAAGAQQSMRMASELVARDPDRPSWLAQLAEARALVGIVLYSQDVSLPEARSMVESSRDVYLRLAASQPAEREWKRSLVSHHLNVGALCERLGDLPAALAAQRASIEMSRRLLVDTPDDVKLQEELANALAWHSTSLEQSGDLAAAVRAREENMRLLERTLARDPKSAPARSDLSVAHSYLAGLLVGRGDLAGAEAHYRASQELGLALTGTDPANATWRLNLAMSGSNLAQVLLDQGRPAEALPLLDAAIMPVVALLADNPENQDWTRQLAAHRARRGRVLGVLGRFEQGRRELDRAQAMYEPLVAANPGGLVAVRSAEVAQARGELEKRAGNQEAAVEAWDEALRRLPPRGKRSDHRTVSLRARLLLYLQRPQEARPLLERLRAMGGGSSTLFALAREQGLDLSPPVASPGKTAVRR